MSARRTHLESEAPAFAGAFYFEHGNHLIFQWMLLAFNGA